MTVVLALLQTAVILEEFVVVVEVAEAVVPVGNRAVGEMFHTAAGGKAPGDGDNDAEPGPSGMWHASELTEAQETLPAVEKEMSHNQQFCSHTAANTRTYDCGPAFDSREFVRIALHEKTEIRIGLSNSAAHTKLKIPRTKIICKPLGIG
jgi:hypothetical protein